MSTLTRPDRAPPQSPAIPPLRNGDRLSAEEFERRFDAMPGLKKAELINGIVYMPSPVYFDDHGGPHFDTIGWLSIYRIATRGVRGGDNSTLRLPLANRPQPDAFLIVLPEFGGQVKIDDSGYVVGGPELIAEISATSESYDLHDKLDLYRTNGVQEYVVWRVFNRTIDWFVLQDGEYQRCSLDADGNYRSRILPGLWLDPAALIAGDMARVAEVAQLGVASAEHAAFVAQLQQAARERRG